MIIRFNNLDYTILADKDDLSFADTGHVFKHHSDGTVGMFKEPKFVIKNGSVNRIDYQPDGLWRDRFGTAYGIRETDSFTDPTPECGVGFFTLSPGNPLNNACKYHDYKYESYLYRMYHTQFEADQDLKRDLELVGSGKLISNTFYGIVRQLGLWFYK